MVEQPMPSRRAKATSGELPMGEPCGRRALGVGVEAAVLQDLAGKAARCGSPSSTSYITPQAKAQWRIDATMFLPTPNAAMAFSSEKVDLRISPHRSLGRRPS